MPFLILFGFFGVWVGLVSYPWFSKLRGEKFFMQWLKNIPDAVILIGYVIAIPGLSTALIHKKSIKKYFDD